MAEAERKSAPSKVLRLPSFRKPYRPRPQSQITALDVDGQTLRLVQATPHGNGTAVTRVVAAPLDLPAEAERSDPAIMGVALAKALTQLKLRPSPVLMGVPRAQVVLRTLTLPVLEDLRELASMVHFQIGRDLPFRMDEAVIDFKVRRVVSVPPTRLEPTAKTEEATEPPPPPKLEVLVAAVKRDVVEFYQQTAEAAGLKLAALGLLSYANARCVEECHVADGELAFALVSLRPDEVSIDVIAQQTLLFSRGAIVKPHLEAAAPSASSEPATAVPSEAAPERTLETVGGAPAIPVEPPKPETFADLVTIEVVRSLHSYSGMEPHNPTAKVVVTGASGQEADVVEALSKRLSVPCNLLDPASALDLPADSREHASGAIAAIGLALGVNDPQGLPFDFLNPKRPAVHRDMRRIRILAGAAAAVALLVFVMGLRSYLINRRLKINNQVATEYDAAKSKQPIYKRMVQQAGSIDEWARGGSDWLQHYAYLSAILPPSEEVYITSLSVGGKGIIRLTVQARSGETLAKLEKQLHAAGYDVKPLAITPGADRFGYEFRSNVELVVPEKMKIDLTKVKTPARPADDASLDPSVHKRGGA